MVTDSDIFNVTKVDKEAIKSLAKVSRKEALEYLHKAFEQTSRSDGCADLAAFGAYLRTFTPVNYKQFGFTKLKSCIKSTGLFKFRKSSVDFDGYRIRWFPIVPMIFIASSLWLMSQAILSNPKACLIGSLIIAAGVPVYLRTRKKIADGHNGRAA